MGIPNGTPLSKLSPPNYGEKGKNQKQQEAGDGSARKAGISCIVRSPRRPGWVSPDRTPRRGVPTWEGEDFVPRLAGVYTFGQPRVGDSTFRECYNFSGLMGRTFRVVHADDIVPRVPWLLGAYRHAGHEVFYTGIESEFRAV